MSAQVVSAQFNGTTPVTVAHSLGVVPTAIIGLSAAGTALDITGSTNHGLSFYDVANDEYAALARQISHGAATAFGATRFDNTAGLARVNGARRFTFSNVDTDSFDVVCDVSNTNYIAFLVIAGVNVQVGSQTSPTSAGAQVLETGLDFIPKAALFLPSRAPAANTDYNAS